MKVGRSALFRHLDVLIRSHTHIATTTYSISIVQRDLSTLTTVAYSWSHAPRREKVHTPTLSVLFDSRFSFILSVALLVWWQNFSRCVFLPLLV